MNRWLAFSVVNKGCLLVQRQGKTMFHGAGGRDRTNLEGAVKYE